MKQKIELLCVKNSKTLRPVLPDLFFGRRFYLVNGDFSSKFLITKTLYICLVNYFISMAFFVFVCVN